MPSATKTFLERKVLDSKELYLRVGSEDIEGYTSAAMLSIDKGKRSNTRYGQRLCCNVSMGPLPHLPADQ